MEKISKNLNLWFSMGEFDSMMNLWNPPSHCEKCFNAYCAGQEFDYSGRFDYSNYI